MNRKQILAATIAAVLSTGLVVSSTSLAVAADAATGTSLPAKEQEAKSSDQQNQADRDLLMVSEDARFSMRDLHRARLAIFNGEPTDARTYVDAAVTRINSAQKEADKYALDIKAPQSEDRYIPFDSSIAVMDTFEPTSEKSQHIAKAGKQLHRGEHKQALETLKLGDVDIAVTSELVPVQFAQEHIAQASKLVSEGKYYQANLALKAVDDAVIEQTFAIDAIPKADASSQVKDNG